MTEREKTWAVAAVLGSWMVGMIMASALWITAAFLAAEHETRALQYKVLFGLNPPSTPVERIEQENVVRAVLIQMRVEVELAREVYQHKLLTDQVTEADSAVMEKVRWRFVLAHQAAEYFQVIGDGDRPALSANPGLISSISHAIWVMACDILLIFC